MKTRPTINDFPAQFQAQIAEQIGKGMGKCANKGDKPVTVAKTEL